MSDTGQRTRMPNNQQGIGQHRSDGSSLSADYGQRSTVKPGARVGQANGPEANMKVPASSKDADIGTTTHGGPVERGETHPGADDRK